MTGVAMIRRNLIKTFSTGSDELLHPVLNKEMRGIWTLKVADLEEGDEGSLNSWGLRYYIRERSGISLRIDSVK
jgi:subtilisin-like proprotein convertase family protein